MATKTPELFFEQYNGKAVNRGDGWNDSAYGYQCVAGFKTFCEWAGIPVKATPNGWADGYWISRDALKFGEYFDFITNPDAFRDGDWIIWGRGSASHPKSHVAMMFRDQEFGENQGSVGFNLKTTNFQDALGALRWKDWSASEIPFGASELTISGRNYQLYRQNPQLETFAVLSAGLNKLAPISQLDANAYVTAKITGANYFQMKADQSDPYGTTYGDISAPLNDIWRQLPNQDTTLYFDADTGMYGDCTGVTLDPAHNVFSPSVVYPHDGRFQYARMVGIDHVNTSSIYTFSIRLTDGSYILGLAEQESTPKQIAEDFRVYMMFETIAFLDGGGSAQMGRWDTEKKKFEYIRDTGRAVPSAFAIIEKKPIGNPAQDEESEAQQDETQKDEGQDMSNEKPQETPETSPVEGWTDPEPGAGTTILERISALLSVKSIITLAFVGAYLAMVLQERQVPSLFENILTMIVSFFFGYQFKKAEK